MSAQPDMDDLTAQRDREALAHVRWLLTARTRALSRVTDERDAARAELQRINEGKGTNT